ncbi:hypothetical protein [Streptomyces sp. NPDC049881]|uniref:hypothetical protein n=1 Tax=Streptomyces sp. NPDC049881 TaxID=3155778 RepID=UPI00341848BD
MSSYGQYPAAPGAAPTGGAAPGPDRNLLFAGLAGAALILIGSLLAWSTVSAPEGVDGSSESSGGTNGDGLWTLIAALVIGALLVAALVRKNATLALASVVPSLIALVVVVLNIFDAERTARADLSGEDLSSEDLDMFFELVDVSVGVGVWIALVGSLVAVGAAAYAGVKARS